MDSRGCQKQLSRDGASDVWCSPPGLHGQNDATGPRSPPLITGGSIQGFQRERIRAKSLVGRRRVTRRQFGFTTSPAVAERTNPLQIAELCRMGAGQLGRVDIECCQHAGQQERLVSGLFELTKIMRRKAEVPRDAI